MMLATLLVRRVRPGNVIAAGLVLAAVGFAVVSQVGDRSGLAVVVIGLSLVFADLMPVAALGADIIASFVPIRRLGKIVLTGTGLGSWGGMHPTTSHSGDLTRGTS